MVQVFIESVSLLYVLLNPFLMVIYLLDLIQGLEGKVFRRVLIRGSTIATAVFIAFAVTGDALFENILRVRFAAFLIFGGVYFFIVGLRFLSGGPSAVQQLRGEPAHVAGSIAMPFMVGPATVSASVIIGAKLPVYFAIFAIICAMILVASSLLLLKIIHDVIKGQHATLLERYIDLTGRTSGALIGSIAVDMVLKGIELWLGKLP